MLPVVETMRTVALRIVMYSLMLWALTLIFTPVAGMGWLYTVSAIVLGAIFLGLALQVLRRPEPALAMRLFGWSITYVTLLFAAMAADEIVRNGV